PWCPLPAFPAHRRKCGGPARRRQRQHDAHGRATEEWHPERVEVNGPRDAACRLTLTGRTTYTGGEPDESDATFKVTGRTAVRVTLVVCIAIAVFAAWKLGLFDLTSRERLRDMVGRVQAVGFLKPAFVGVYALTSAI